jgi:hypothetical protein
MRLCGVRDGVVYGVDGREVVEGPVRPGRAVELPGRGVRAQVAGGGLERVGRLPRAAGLAPARRLLTGPAAGAVTTLVGEVATATVYRLSATDWLAATGSQLFSSHDGGASWQRRRGLARSSGPMGVLPTAVCEHDGTVLVGEYPLGEEVPRLLASADDGRTWGTRLALPAVRHVHAVQADPHGSGVWVTTGDADDECRIGRLRADRNDLDVVGGGSQEWRAVELAFTREAVLWGMDCGYADGNGLFRLDRSDLGDVGEDPPCPVPTRVGEADGSVYYAATLSVEGVEWVVFSTAVETGQDRTAPDETASGAPAQVLAASARTGFTEWHELARFEKRGRLADHLPRLPSANAYVSLAAGPDGGLLVNPFNTAGLGGQLLRVPPEVFAALAQR